MNLYVNTDELLQIATKIKNLKLTASNIYNLEVKKLMNDPDLKDFNMSEFNRMFTTLINRLDKMSDTLRYDIVPKYNSLNSTIRNTINLNDDLKDLLNSLK